MWRRITPVGASVRFDGASRDGAVVLDREGDVDVLCVGSSDGGVLIESVGNQSIDAFLETSIDHARVGFIVRRRPFRGWLASRRIGFRIEVVSECPSHDLAFGGVERLEAFDEFVVRAKRDLTHRVRSVLLYTILFERLLGVRRAAVGPLSIE